MVTEDSPEPIEGSSAENSAEKSASADAGAGAAAAAAAAATKGGLTIVATIVLVLLLLLTILIPVFAGPASEASEPGIDIGPCTGFADSADVSPGHIDPTATTGVYVAQLKGSATYFGSVNIAADTPRPVSGEISVATPPLFPSIPVGGGWGPEGDELSDEGTETWDIPTWAPRGVVFNVSGFHSEAGADCQGFILVMLDGGPFDSIIVWIPIVIAILLVLIFLIAVKNGKPVLAGIVGLFAGLSLGTSEIFLGVQQLDGPAPTVLAIAFLVGGIVAASAQKKAMSVN